MDGKVRWRAAKQPTHVMAGLDPAIHETDSFAARTRGGWMAGSVAGHDDNEEWKLCAFITIGMPI